MRLPRLAGRERNNANTINTTAARSNAPPMASAPPRLNPEGFSADAAAGAFVCVPAISGGATFVGLAADSAGGGTAFVELVKDAAGGGFDSTSAGGGLLKFAVGGSEGIRLVLTFVPIITSGGRWTTGGGFDSTLAGGGLVLGSGVG